MYTRSRKKKNWKFCLLSSGTIRNDLGWPWEPKLPSVCTVPSGPICSKSTRPTFRFYLAMLFMRGISHGPVPVCVCLSQVGVLLKRLNVGVGSHRFLTPKISAKFDRGHPLRGHQMQVGWVKIGDFRQITGYILKMVQDRRMVSYALYRMVTLWMTLSDP